MMDNPHNVATFAVKSIRRRGKRRVQMTGDTGGNIRTMILKIPDDRMRDVQRFMQEFEGTLLVSFDVPPLVPFSPSEFIEYLERATHNGAPHE